jgi:hypothetical protein
MGCQLTILEEWSLYPSHMQRITVMLITNELNAFALDVRGRFASNTFDEVPFTIDMFDRV